jgi:hypothetical protein
MNLRAKPERFLVAFSFADEQRRLVREVAEAVEQRLGWGTVFFDEWFKHEIVSLNYSDLKLQQIYGERSDLVVIGVSREYGQKVWTGLEWDSIRARLLMNGGDQRERIWPMRVGDGDIPGLLPNTIYDDARNSSPKDAADRIVARLRQFKLDAGKPSVFLAECLYELEDEANPVSRQRLKTAMEEAGWQVFPKQSLVDDEDYLHSLETELGKCRAFVQMLGPSPWKGAKCDRQQFEAAQRHSLPIYRYLVDCDLNKLKSSNSEHHKFVTDNSRQGSFRDFQDELRKELDGLLREREKEIRNWQRPVQSKDQVRRIGIVYHAHDPRTIWERVYERLECRMDLVHDELCPQTSLVDLQQQDPCHGFLILCDHAAQSDEQKTPRETLSQCQRIQRQILKLKNDRNQCPPVGLIYWPPPDPQWASLLRANPLNDRLHKITQDNLDDLERFFDQVCEVSGDFQ